MSGTEERGKRPKREGDICIHIADSLHCTVETNIILSNYTPIKKKKKRSRLQSASGPLRGRYRDTSAVKND